MVAARVHLMTVAPRHGREPRRADILERLGVVVMPDASPVGGPGHPVLEALSKRARQRLAVLVEVIARLLVPHVPRGHERDVVVRRHQAAVIRRPGAAILELNVEHRPIPAEPGDRRHDVQVLILDVVAEVVRVVVRRNDAVQPLAVLGERSRRVERQVALVPVPEARPGPAPEERAAPEVNHVGPLRLWLLGDDVDDPAWLGLAIQYRCRALHHLDPLHVDGRGRICCRCSTPGRRE